MFKKLMCDLRIGVAKENEQITHVHSQLFFSDH